MLQKYFKSLYERTMRKAYALAVDEIIRSIGEDGRCLDCGANEGRMYETLAKSAGLNRQRYFGIEWNSECVNDGIKKGLNIIQGDLNKPLPYDDREFRCVFGLSILEHLLNGCSYLREAYRVLEDKGSLIILTPNISTYFTIALLLLGKMPSSGPHPDSGALLRSEEPIKVSNIQVFDVESDTPVHRHIVVFSYRVLKKYLEMVGFSEVKGYGFGLYPFPNFMQPVLENLDPYHCHQMVFIARK